MNIMHKMIRDQHAITAVIFIYKQLSNFILLLAKVLLQKKSKVFGTCFLFLFWGQMFTKKYVLLRMALLIKRKEK